MRTIEDVLSCQFGRKAVETGRILRNGRPCAANLIRDLLEEVNKLSQYCQLSEFTEHGLPHIASLVYRIETWEKADGTFLRDCLTNDEAFLLLLAVIIHDIGMLSQQESDLKEADRLKYARVFADLPMWIRRTHVLRLENVVRRLLRDRYSEFLESSLFSLGASLARSHQHWPNGEGYQELEHLAQENGFAPDRVKALAGILAVADLLDEDSGRCDTMTLFANKAGNVMNRAHWLRHMLVEGPLLIVRGMVTVKIRVPTDIKDKVEPAIEGLRNHLRLAQVYNTVLSTLQAEICFDFPPSTSCGEVPKGELPLQLLFHEPGIHLMRTLLPEALPGATQSEPEGTNVEVMGVTLKRVNRTMLDQALGPASFQSGRSDLEITYAAASLRGENSRQQALKILRDAAVEADARGDITLVRRLSSLVIGDLIRHEVHSLTNVFWAAAYILHWADHEHDLHSLETLLKRLGGDGIVSTTQAMDEILARLPLDWQVLGLTTQVLLLRRDISVKQLDSMIERRLESLETPLSIEEQIAWYDLVEALWATGYLANDDLEGFHSLLDKLLRLEQNLSPSQRLLAELAWRIAVQSRCLRGYGRWEAPPTPMDRRYYELPPDPSRETIARVWISWFNGCNETELIELARQARAENPPGSELYVAALEAEQLISNTINKARWADDNALHRYQEFSDATERDDAHRLINRIVSSILNTDLAPKKEGTIYFGGRGVERLHYKAILGERVSLRRWYLDSWHRVVAHHVRTMLSLAHTMRLEGDKVIQPVLEGLQRLPWGIYNVGKGKELLETLFPQVEPHITTDELTPVLESMARSPRRIGNIHHPGLKILGDALKPEILPVLVEWTNLELKGPTFPLSLSNFEVWPDLMKHANLTIKIWARLVPLLHHALRLMRGDDPSARIVQAAITKAPWSIAGPLVRRIADTLNRSGIAEDWVETAKLVVTNGLLQREKEDWLESEEYLILLRAVNHLAALSQAPDDQIMLEFLSSPASTKGHRVADRWLELLEYITKIATTRKKSDAVAFYHIPGFAVGPSRTIQDEEAQRAANALKELWEAKYATTEELAKGTSIAGHLFRASTGNGRKALLQPLLAAMASNRTGIGFLVRDEECSSIAWKCVATHSACLPEEALSEVTRLLMERLFHVPLHAAWAQSRLATEVLLRSNVSEDHQLALSALFTTRARTAEKPRLSAETLIASVGRMLQEENWPSVLRTTLGFFVSWIEEASLAPEPEARRGVAGICRGLAKRLTGSLQDRLSETLNRLRKDPRMRVRSAVENQEE